MLADRDSNVSGRTSRASNMSTMSRAPSRQPYNTGKTDPLAGPGVMSMLRTTTEMGNVVGLTGDFSGMGSLPRASQRRAGSSRLSTTSSLSNNSSRASRHHRHWPSSSSGPRYSMREPQYVADTLSPTVMNIPGSSPPIPRTRHRDSHRSLSMTNTIQPTYRLSSNRSLGSLRHEPVLQRPKSPYIYPTRLRRPGYRPVSPALSDNPGSQPRRLHGHGSQGHAYHPGPTRLRFPSDVSLGHHERQERMVPPGPSRGPSPVYLMGPRVDMPPMPHGYQHHIAVEQARLLNRSVKGSMSSGSTNVRTDSDAPSSDMALPSTPKNGTSMEVLIIPNGTQVMIDSANGTRQATPVDTPMYYDYSEHFDGGQIVEPIPIMKERAAIGLSVSHASASSGIVPVGVAAPGIPEIAELPASPVARRITRDLIRQALEPASTTGDMASSERTTALRTDDYSEGLPAMTLPTDDAETAADPSLRPRDPLSNRYSILSQTGSSVLDSSTLEFAVRCSIPMANGGGFEAREDSTGKRHPPSSPGRSTEDGMSELLAGYQHTRSKHEATELAVGDTTPKDQEDLDGQFERRSNHGQKSSDGQSFKSCTNLSEVVSETASPDVEKDEDAKSFASAVDTVPTAIPCQDRRNKDSDARSFQTAKDSVTPERAWSMPPSRLPSSSLANELDHHKPSMSDLSFPAPSAALLRKPVPQRESSFSLMASKLLANSRPVIKQGSVSMSCSSSTLSTTQQTPSVPPRESSSSKEAQRYHAVASFLMRQLPTRKSKSPKQIMVEDSRPAEGHPLGQDPNAGAKGQAEIHLSSDLFGTGIIIPEKVLVKHSVMLDSRAAEPFPELESNGPQISESSASLGSHQHSLSSPVSTIQEPSSIYSPRDVSLRQRVHSFPAGVPRSLDHGRRDSQTTTHLVWASGQPFGIASAGVKKAQIPLSGIQENNTTTDLRLSQYRYVGPSQYLPDLKEESHEDSSLNTSASNLKHSSFRFPVGPPAMRVSVDDVAMYPRRSSFGSYPRGVVGTSFAQSRRLPSMHFSHMNLIEKLHEELGLRYSRSVEDVTADLKALVADHPPRSASADEVHEKYRSIIMDLELVKNSLEGTQATMTHDRTLKGARSPEKLIAELEQLTIPSVGGLTQRISELLPSLKESYRLIDRDEFPDEELIMEHALGEIQEVHPTQKRSSARLRPLPGSPHMVVVEDDLFQEITSRKEEGDVHGRPGDYFLKGGAGEGRFSAKENGKSSTHTPTRQLAPLAELDTPTSSSLRPRAVTVGHREFRASGDSALSSRRSLRSFVSTPTTTDTRPWNFDKNYPWATTTIPSVDISLPPPTTIRHSPRPGPSHLRNRLSHSTTSSSFSTIHSATASPPESHNHARRHRFSAFGRIGDQSHAVGERYPTSALTPPTAIFRDHFTASEISDDEDFNTTRKTKLGLRKHFSLVRKATLEKNDRAARSKTNPQELASPRSTNESTSSHLQDSAGETQAFTSHRHTFREAEGMRPADYHCQRLVDRIKHWWHKGGKLIRSLSRRTRQESIDTL
ncbi:hypothetical protein ACN47E_001370 [Coniothyrium glycines]